jgi:hypothetical protein
MRARLTHISLTLPGRVIAVGEEVVGGDDLPLELLLARLNAGTAELVLSGDQVSPELQAAITAYIGAADHLQALMVGLADVALAGPTGSARAVLVALQEALKDRAAQAVAVTEKFAELERRAEADQLVLAQDLQSAGSPAPGGGEAGASAASEAAAEDGPAAAENSSGPTAAPTDAPQPQAGTDGEAAAAPAAAVEPAAPATSSTARKRPARKGAAKAVK